MDTQAELDLIKAALEHFRNRLSEFKTKQTYENGYHNSMFPDVDKEVNGIIDLISKISLTYAYDGKEAGIMRKALHVYEQDLATIHEQTKTRFPEVGDRELQELKKTILKIKAEF